VPLEYEKEQAFLGEGRKAKGEGNSKPRAIGSRAIRCSEIQGLNLGFTFAFRPLPFAFYTAAHDAH
jgi:hypothetical protein